MIDRCQFIHTFYTTQTHWKTGGHFQKCLYQCLCSDIVGLYLHPRHFLQPSLVSQTPSESGFQPPAYQWQHYLDLRHRVQYKGLLRHTVTYEGIQIHKDLNTANTRQRDIVHVFLRHVLWCLWHYKAHKGYIINIYIFIRTTDMMNLLIHTFRRGYGQNPPLKVCM